MASKKGTDSSEGHFDIFSSSFGDFGQQEQICVTSMPDFTVSRCGNLFERNECITSQEKKDKIISQCQGILKEKSVSIRELTQVVGRLCSTAITVLAAPLQYRAVQRQQIAELAITKNFDSMIVLTIVYRKTDHLEVDSYVLLFLKVC